MSKEQENKAIVGRWFTEFWGNPWNPKVIDELAAPDMLLQYSLHEPRRGREDVRDFITGFRKAFPDLGFAGAADLPRATGKSGTLAAPNKSAPTLPRKLRRETRRAMSRARRSTRASMELRMQALAAGQGVTRTVGVRPSGSTLLRNFPELAS